MQLPATFGKYELLERIATGGMAEVFLARSFGVAGFEKRLVIKRIRPELAQDPRFIKMFINEAKIGVHLNHPNVVQTYDLGRANSTWYMAMEHLHGRDLNKLVKVLRADERRLHPHVAAGVVAETLRGLAYAHSRTDAKGQLLGLVHRDVSPHNLLLTFAGEVKVVDFGVARLMNTMQADAEGLGSGRPGGGKYAYMSPEQASNGTIDHRTDIFAAGIVLWELIAGTRLYHDRDPSEKLRRVREADVPHPSTLGVEVHPDLWALTQRALDVDPEQRFGSASDFEEALRAWLYDQGAKDHRQAIAAEMRQAFPHLLDQDAHAIDLQRMVEDVDRLDPIDKSDSHGSSGLSQGDENSLPAALRSADGEVKRVVVLIIDVDGLTELSARVDPEHLFKRHYQVLRWMRRVVDRYGGRVHRAVDDQITVLFGVPRTQNDDASRALECALELSRSVRELGRKGLAIKLAIGVHAGDITLAIAGKKVRYTARGDTTRLARRISAVADHGEILVSERVLPAAESHFRLRRGPDVANRGGAAPTPTFQLEGRRKDQRVAGKGPWLRRANELEQVRSALLDLVQGTGRVLWLLGDVGSGKSRLVLELKDLGRRRGVPMYVGRCTRYAQHPPLGPLRELLQEILGLERDTPRDRVSERLETLRQLGLDEVDINPLATLLGVRRATGGRGGEDLIWRAIDKVMASLSADQPAIFAIEDLHLLPPAELQRMVSLAQRASARAILLLTYTGELPTALRSVGTQVTLGAFDRAGLERLLRHVLGVSTVDTPLVELVERCCEGNPLYAEELAKYLLNEGRLSREDDHAALVGASSLELPDSLASLIATRLDALEPGSKGALQLAATLGPTFSATLLARAMGLDDPTPLVSNLARHGLVRRTGGEHSDTWAFASELVHAAATRGILGVQRRAYHQLLASAIESTYAHELEAWNLTLAHHCAEGGRLIDAARYAFAAGSRFETDQLLVRARDAFQQGLAWILEAPTAPQHWDARVQGEATLQYRLGAVSGLLGDTKAAEHALQMALDIASDAGLAWIEVRAHLHLGKVYVARGRLVLADAHIEQARALARLESDPSIHQECLESAAHLAHERGQDDEAEALWIEALAHADGDLPATARCNLGMASRRIRSGRLDEAEVLLDEALVAARGGQDRILLGRVLNNLGLLHYWACRYDAALKSFREALRVREGIGYTAGVVINHHNIGDVHFSRGDLSRAWVAFRRSHEVAVAMGWERGVLLNEVYLGFIDATRGAHEQGLDMVRKATERAERIGDVELAANGCVMAARLLIDAGQSDEAAVLIERASQQAHEHGLQAILEAIEAIEQPAQPPVSLAETPG